MTFIYVYVCLCEYKSGVYGYPQRSEEDIVCPGAGVIGTCELRRGCWKQLWSSGRAGRALNC